MASFNLSAFRRGLLGSDEGNSVPALPASLLGAIQTPAPITSGLLGAAPAPAAAPSAPSLPANVRFDADRNGYWTTQGQDETFTPASDAPSWFKNPAAGWNYNTETMAGPPEWMAASNLANIISPQLAAAGYSGPATVSTGSGQDQGPQTVAPGLSDWLSKGGMTLGGDWTGPTTVTANISDSAGKQIASQQYDNGSDPLLGALINLGVGVVTGGAGGGIGGASGLSGAAAGAANGALAGGIISGGNGGNPLQGAVVGGLLGGAGSYAKDAISSGLSPTTDVSYPGDPSLEPFPDNGGLTPADAMRAGEAAQQQANGGSFTSSVFTPGDPSAEAAQFVRNLTPQELASLSPAQQQLVQPALDAFNAASPAAVAPTATPSPSPSPAPTPQPAFRPSADSQAANQQLGIGGDDIKAIAPSTVNMGSLGGTTATAGGLQGALDTIGQNLTDAKGSITAGASDVASWLKANPTLGKLLFGGALAALNSSGGSGSGAGAVKAYGAPVRWNSPASALTPGLLGSNVKQVQPPAITGLLGNVADGAWRWGR